MNRKCLCDCARIAAVFLLCLATNQLAAAQVPEGLLAQRGRGNLTAQPTDLPGLQTHLDIPYAHIEGVDPNRLSLDIYAPPDAHNLPVVLFVHGGGWTAGDKRAAARLPHPQFFCSQGFVYISTNYRLVPAVRHPDNARDVAAATAWVHDHIGDYGGDPDRIFLMGHSAGAHLVALVATDHRHLAASGKDLSIIKGVISNDTQAYDLAVIMTQMRPAARLYPKVFGTDPQLWHDASPIKHVAPGKNIPPFLILHSTSSSYVRTRAEHATAMAEALHTAGYQARVVGAPNRTHGQINQWLGREGEVTTNEVLRFLKAESELNATPPL